MTVRLIGDIHGNLFDYQKIIESNNVTNSIQVGDFGIGFRGDYWHQKVNEIHSSDNHRFIRGNHDDPQRCQTMVGYMGDYGVEGEMMWVGGAWSIDQMYRTIGIDWWPDEELSREAFDEVEKIYLDTKPKVMITHDCPSNVSTEMFIKQGLSIAGGSVFYTRTGEMLQHLAELHKPEFHFFGHWHHTKAFKQAGTTYVCLGINDFIDVDLTDSAQMTDAVSKIRGG